MGRTRANGASQRNGPNQAVLWALIISILSIIVGFSTNLVSDKVPQSIARFALPLFFLSSIALVGAGVWQAVQSISGRHQDRSQERKLRDLRQMLHLVDAAINAVLRENFTNVPRIQFGLRARPELIQGADPAPDIIKGLSEPSQTCNEDVVDLFEHNGRSLLVVGNGGFGKTILLAELCRDLCAKVSPHDQNPLIPVLINLGSWSDQDSSLADWLSRAISETYSVSADSVAQWLKDGALLPILDGLDEVQGKLRNKVLQAIDAFIDEGPVPMVIGSRTREYLNCSTRLRLTYAVEIQPLERQQVKNYLKNLETPSIKAVASVSGKDVKWWEMIGTPLMLGMISQISLIEPDADLVTIGSIHERRRHIIEVYVRCLAKRRLAQSKFTPEDGISWLGWLAEWMTRHKSSEFHYDRIKSAWIKDIGDPDEVKQSPLKWISRSLYAAFTTINVIMIFYGDAFPLIFLLAGFGFPMARLTRNNLRKNHCSSTESIKPIWAIKGAWNRMVALVMLSSAIGVSLITIVLVALDLDAGGPLVFINAMVGGVIASTPSIIATHEPKSLPDEIEMAPGERLRRSRRNAWLGALLIGLLGSILAGLLVAHGTHSMGTGISFMASFGIISGINCWLICGGAPVLQHRMLAREIKRANCGPLDYLAFLEWARERLLLRTIGSAYTFPHGEIQAYLSDSWRKSQKASGRRGAVSSRR